MFFKILSKIFIQTASLSTTLADPKTKQREMQGLIEAMKQHNVPKGLILTTDANEGKEVHENYEIEIQEIWKWLLNK